MPSLTVRSLAADYSGVVNDGTVENQELIAQSFARPHARMTAREAGIEAAVGSAFLLAVLALWLAAPPHGLRIVPALLCVDVLALATRVRFDTPFGFTAPTQLAFVPLLFAVPLSLVPLAVVLGVGAPALIELARGRRRAVRVLQTPANCWWAIGPVAVFVISGVSPARAGAGLLLAALGAQFALDFANAAVRYCLGRGATLSSQLREMWVYGVDAALSGVALLVARPMQTAPADVLMLVPVLGLFALFARERRQRLEGMLELGNAYRGTALVLGDVVEADDGYTGVHCKSVVTLALEVGKRLALSPEQQRNLEFGALLHDVGKIAIPKDIINKPGQLNHAEWTIIKTHTLEGQKMLDRVGGFMHQVGLIVRSHHERWDGSGYPDGFRGEQIPLESRIIACCDTWNAMRTDRAYRRALTHDAAVAELRAASGTQLDARVVQALLELVSAPAATPARERTADTIASASGM